MKAVEAAASRPARSRGVTLIELMVVVSVLVVVLALAAPTFRDMIETQRLRGTSSQLVTDLQFARSESVTRQEPVGMSFKPNATGRSCYIVHSCGTAPVTECSCDCGAAAGSRCTGTRREIRTVDVPTESGVRVAPVRITGAAPPVPAQRVLFDPASGAVTAYFPVLVILPPMPPAPEFWAEVALTRPGTVPSLRTEISATGRPRTCSPGGRVSGVTPCAP